MTAQKYTEFDKLFFRHTARRIRSLIGRLVAELVRGEISYSTLYTEVMQLAHHLGAGRLSDYAQHELENSIHTTVYELYEISERVYAQVLRWERDMQERLSHTEDAA